ncbi:RapZ C-terminal domain-containing protein [Streptomyces rimosus]
MAVHVCSPHGRYRSVAVAEELADRLRAAGIPVQAVHRHLSRPEPPHDP